MPHQYEQIAVKEKPASETSPKPRTPLAFLPPWKVLLHNDDINDKLSVVQAIQEIVSFQRARAIACMKEAHLKDVALMLVTHRERAELIQEQFQSKGLTVTIEPDQA